MVDLTIYESGTSFSFLQWECCAQDKRVLFAISLVQCHKLRAPYVIREDDPEQPIRVHIYTCSPAPISLLKMFVSSSINQQADNAY